MWYYIIFSYLIGIGLFQRTISIIFSPIALPIRFGFILAELFPFHSPQDSEEDNEDIHLHEEIEDDYDETESGVMSETPYVSMRESFTKTYKKTN